eukprot:6478282-Amphidinium_carterae.6
MHHYPLHPLLPVVLDCGGVGWQCCQNLCLCAYVPEAGVLADQARARPEDLLIRPQHLVQVQWCELASHSASLSSTEAEQHPAAPCHARVPMVDLEANGLHRLV